MRIGEGDELAELPCQICSHEAPDGAVAGVEIVVGGRIERRPAVGIDHLEAFGEVCLVQTRCGDAER